MHLPAPHQTRVSLAAWASANIGQNCYGRTGLLAPPPPGGGGRLFLLAVSILFVGFVLFFLLVFCVLNFVRRFLCCLLFFCVLCSIYFMFWVWVSSLFFVVVLLRSDENTKKCPKFQPNVIRIEKKLFRNRQVP